MTEQEKVDKKKLKMKKIMKIKYECSSPEYSDVSGLDSFSNSSAID